MPFRIPTGYRHLSVNAWDAQQSEADLKEYILWLEQELDLAKLAVAQAGKQPVAEG